MAPPRTVRRVLLEAGEGLTRKTQNRLSLVVDTSVVGKGRFQYDCSIDAPRIDFRYPLFKVIEEGDPYPVRIVGDDAFANGVHAANEDSLLDNLRLLFGSEASRKIVLKLLDFEKGSRVTGVRQRRVCACQPIVVLL